MIHFSEMEEVVNFLGGLNNGCAARQELPWVDSPRQASKHAWPVLNCLRAGEKFLGNPNRPHTLFSSKKMASTRIFSPKCLKILTSFKFLFFMCKTTDIFFGHFQLFHGKEKQFFIFLDFMLKTHLSKDPLTSRPCIMKSKNNSPPHPSADALTFLIVRQPATRDDDVNDLRMGRRAWRQGAGRKHFEQLRGKLVWGKDTGC